MLPELSNSLFQIKHKTSCKVWDDLNGTECNPVNQYPVPRHLEDTEAHLHPGAIHGQTLDHTLATPHRWIRRRFLPCASSFPQWSRRHPRGHWRWWSWSPKKQRKRWRYRRSSPIQLNHTDLRRFVIHFKILRGRLVNFCKQLYQTYSASFCHRPYFSTKPTQRPYLSKPW